MMKQINYIYKVQCTKVLAREGEKKEDLLESKFFESNSEALQHIEQLKAEFKEELEKNAKDFKENERLGVFELSYTYTIEELPLIVEGNPTNPLKAEIRFLIQNPIDEMLTKEFGDGKFFTSIGELQILEIMRDFEEPNEDEEYSEHFLTFDLNDYGDKTFEQVIEIIKLSIENSLEDEEEEAEPKNNNIDEETNYCDKHNCFGCGCDGEEEGCASCS